jgi:hypothetical protein
LSKVPYQHAQDGHKKDKLIESVIEILKKGAIQVSAALLKEIVIESARCAAHDSSLEYIPDHIIIATANNRVTS